jgi:hypothetical protein
MGTYWSVKTIGGGRHVGALLRGITALRYYWLLPAAFLAAIAGLMMHSAAAQSPYDCASWSAWMDQTPGPGAIPTLHVRGQCAFRVIGYTVEMRPHLPPSADPNVFLIDLAVHSPAGPQMSGDGSASVSYATIVPAKYQTVLLLPDRIAVPVREVY